jgi:hypothetical protein
VSGYLERLVRRGVGRADAVALRPVAAGAADPSPEIVDVREEVPAERAARPQGHADVAGVAAGAPVSPQLPPSRPAGMASEGAGEATARPLASPWSSSASSPLPAIEPPPVPPQPPLQPRAQPSRAAAAEPPAVNRPSPAARDPRRGHGTVDATTSAASAPPSATRRPSLDPTAVPALAATATARRLEAAEPELAPPWAAPGRPFDARGPDGDGEARIEVHIGRIEVVRPTPPPLPAPLAPPRPPRRGGFADLAATRRYRGRRWY